MGEGEREIERVGDSEREEVEGERQRHRGRKSGRVRE